MMGRKREERSLYDSYCELLELWAASDWATEGQRDQVQPPPGTQSHKSFCWHRVPLPQQLPVPSGDKRAFVGSIKPKVLHSPQVLRFMNDGDRDQGGKRHT